MQMKILEVIRYKVRKLRVRKNKIYLNKFLYTKIYSKKMDKLNIHQIVKTVYYKENIKK